MDKRLSVEVGELAKREGADLVGIAPVERFKNAPLRMSPRGLLPDAKSVIVAAIHHLDAAVELGGEPTPHEMGPYGSQSAGMNPKLDDISFTLARFLEDSGYKTLPIAASNIWRYKGYKNLKVDFAPDIAHRYAAVAAGLGEIGWSGLALTEQFGPRQRFVSVITEADLEPSPMYEGGPLCDKCMECVKMCPTDAFRKEVKKVNEIEIGGKVFKFPDTNKWRCGWAENFGLNLSHSIPEEVNEKVILDYHEKYGAHKGEEGCCLKFCMVPERRYYQSSYCRAPKRKKEKTITSDGILFSKIKEICDRNLVDILAVGHKKDFAAGSLIHPEYHLPDVSSLISIGVRVPLGSSRNFELGGIFARRLSYTAFEIGHFLDISGYSAVTGTKIADNLVAQRLGIYERDVSYTTILTSAEMTSKTSKRTKEKKKIVPGELRGFCKKSGADLAGFFTAERFAKFHKSVEKLGLFPKTTEVVEDAGLLYGRYIPDVRTDEVRIKTLEDWLSGAKSVIVLGLHFPDSSLDTAKVTPAETVGPFAFVQYETLNLLRDIAFRVIKRLNDAGFRATFASDLSGLASEVRNSRGMLPDMRANLFAAVLSGLAYPGVHGHPLTKEYGVRQRFIAIVTDCALPDNPLYDGDNVCEKCKKPCIKSCPTSALKAEGAVLKFEGKKFHFPKVNGFACDWAKRYCLSGREGPQYWGLDVNLPVPKSEKVEDIIGALSRINWGVQKRHINIAEECIRVCPAHKRG